MDDRQVVDAFVAHLRANGYPGLRVDRRPDEENRTSSDIDAVAGSFAIEHTSIDTLPNQRRDADWFMQALGRIEQELDTKMPYRLNITIECAAVRKGQDWSAIHQALKSWLANEASALKDGQHVLDAVSGVPFPLHVTKASNRPPGVFFARFEPDDQTLPKRVRDQLSRKAKKLARYQQPGIITILLVESHDIALMNESIMRQVVQKTFPDGLPSGVDQIWYADTSIASVDRFSEFTSDLGPMRGST